MTDTNPTYRPWKTLAPRPGGSRVFSAAAMRASAVFRLDRALTCGGWSPVRRGERAEVVYVWIAEVTAPTTFAGSFRSATWTGKAGLVTGRSREFQTAGRARPCPE
jgi:hypothetical protein